MTTSRLRAEALGKSYRSRQVVKGLSLEVASGEVVGLLGPNGAGKTTLISLLAGLLTAANGQISLNGQTLAETRAANPRAIAIQAAKNSGLDLTKFEPCLDSKEADIYQALSLNFTIKIKKYMYFCSIFRFLLI